MNVFRMEDEANRLEGVVWVKKGVGEGRNDEVKLSA